MATVKTVMTTTIDISEDEARLVLALLHHVRLGMVGEQAIAAKLLEDLEDYFGESTDMVIFTQNDGEPTEEVVDDITIDVVFVDMGEEE